MLGTEEKEVLFHLLPDPSILGEGGAPTEEGLNTGRNSGKLYSACSRLQAKQGEQFCHVNEWVKKTVRSTT